jgi:hypothetical protein
MYGDPAVDLLPLATTARGGLMSARGFAKGPTPATMKEGLLDNPPSFIETNTRNGAWRF